MGSCYTGENDLWEYQMEVYRTSDGEIAKYVHDDGSETAIKAISKNNKELGHDPVSCGKWALFLSSSVGCPVGCTFCYLTTKNYPYHRLSSLQIYKNAIEAIEAEVEANPSIKNRFFKLSWMGMGDAMFKMKDIRLITEMICDYVRANGYACGIDGVDLSTSLPIWKDEYIDEMVELNEYLEQFPKMDINVEQRSRFRFFYSLGSMCREVRESIIPNTSFTVGSALIDILPKIQKAGIDVICHHVLLETVNDKLIDIHHLEEFFSKSDFELRLLRFNACPGSRHCPSPDFDDIVESLKGTIKRLRYQVSVGSEISAACGMFLMKEPKK